MRYRRQLRSRIIMSFLAFGVGLTALFAGTTLLLREWLEEELIESTLQREVDNFVDFKRRNPEEGARFRFSTDIFADVYSARKFPNVPFAWQKFETGVYDIVEGAGSQERHFKLAVRRDDDMWGFLRYDVTEERRTRGQLVVALALASIAFAALSLLVAIWLSHRVLRPVTDLAERVANLAKSKPEP